jgi:hypothetical protein
LLGSTAGALAGGAEGVGGADGVVVVVAAGRAVAASPANRVAAGLPDAADKRLYPELGADPVAGGPSALSRTLSSVMETVEVRVRRMVTRRDVPGIS